MAAICGAMVNLKKDRLEGIIRQMIDAMKFRCNENAQCLSQDGLALGWQNSYSNNILKISSNETGQIIAIGEGEIYNYREIANDLKSKDHRIDESGIWNVIPHLYEDYGADFPARINGIFVIAVYDRIHQTLLLARDHMGSHSAFYYAANGRFCFSTTIKALLQSGLFTPEISKRAINLYFSGTCVPHPHTMFENIKTLRPGYVLIWQNDDIKEHEYWQLGDIHEDYRRPETSFMEEIREICLDAINIRSGNRNELGSVLSGGVDSSLIASVVSQKNPDPLNVFSIAYHESAFDDAPLQQIMLERFPLKGYQEYLTEKMAVPILKQVITNSDYPINNASAMGTFLCMKLAKKQGMKYVLEGEAADELFCGGGGVVGEHLIEFIERFPFWLRKYTFGNFGHSLQIDKPGKISAFRRFCYRTVMPKIDRMLTWLPACDRKTRKQLLTSDFSDVIDQEDELAPGRYYVERAKMKDDINLYLYGGIKTYLCNDLLFKNERMAAANGITNRTPFIDYRLVELAFRIPAKYKITGYSPKKCEKKLIYRKAIHNMIPDEILWRKKVRGFSQPTTIWMKKGVLNDLLLETLLGKDTKERGIWNTKFVKKMFDEHINGICDRDRLLWGMLTFELWCREFLDS